SIGAVQIKRTHQLHQNDAKVQKKTLTTREVQRMKTADHTKKTLWIHLSEEYKRKRGKSQKNTLNQNKVLDEILRRLQNIEKRQGTYVPNRS
ncbi:16242_t:CDS:2, partial [Gigaspora margarita]